MSTKTATKLDKIVEDVTTLTQETAQVRHDAEGQARMQAEHMQMVQRRLLTIYTSFMTHWVERRQVATQRALEAAQRAVGSNGEPSSLPQIYSDWLQGSMERVAEDIREYQECSSEIVAIMQEALPLLHRDGQSQSQGPKN